MSKEEKETFIIKPHNTKSREVKDEDMERVLADAKLMIDYCQNPPKEFKVIVALGHSQITKKDPLKFFVTSEGKIIINPVILLHTRHTVDSLEGCVTFPNKPNITVQRYNKCEVEYFIVNKDKEIEKVTEKLNGLDARMFQHEIDHFEAKYIYKI